jgi:hypothetical protein
MARNFVKASSQKLVQASAVLTAVPLTMACWARPTVAAGTAFGIISIDDNTTANRFMVWVSAAGKPSLVVNATFTLNHATSYTQNVWGHYCGVFKANTGALARSIFFNGTGKVSNTSSATPGAMTQTVAGFGGGSSFMDGDIAEYAIWNIALTDAEVAIIGSATTPISPLLMHPESLVFYAPLLSPVVNPEIELMRARNLTPSASVPTLADHPRIFYPKPRWVGKMKAAFTNFPDRDTRNWERPNRLITREVIGY